MALAPSPTRQMRMDAFLPQAVAEGWTCDQLSAATGLDRGTAARYLRMMANKNSLSTERRVMRISSRAGAIFGDAATRQLDELERLNAIPSDAWTQEDRSAEKHAISMLGPLIKWTQMRTADADPGGADPPQLSDGL